MNILSILITILASVSCMVSLIDNSLNADWEAYKVEHKKKYNGLDEELSRSAI